MKPSLINSNTFSGKSNIKSYILDSFPLFHNEITWYVPDFLQKGRDSLIFPALKIECEIPWFSLTLAYLHSALYRQKKTNWPSKRETFFFKNEQWESRAHPFSKSAPERKTVRHDGRTVFRKVRPNASLLMLLHRMKQIFTKKTYTFDFIIIVSL